MIILIILIVLNNDDVHDVDNEAMFNDNNEVIPIMK